MGKDLETIQLFKKAAFEILSTYSLNDLRKYGRYLKLQRPTDLNKNDLLEQIIEVLSSETSPLRTGRGAPVKNITLPVSMILQMEKLKKDLFGEEMVVVQSKEMEIINEVPVEEQTEKVIQEQTERDNENSVRLQFSIDLQTLTKEQKYKLFDFLNDL